MNWTPKKPKKPGFYWIRAYWFRKDYKQWESPLDSPQIISLEHGESLHDDYLNGSYFGWYGEEEDEISKTYIEFAGPIKKPNESKKLVRIKI